MISYRNKGFKDLRMRFNPHFDFLNQAMLCPLEKGRLGIEQEYLLPWDLGFKDNHPPLPPPSKGEHSLISGTTQDKQPHNLQQLPSL